MERGLFLVAAVQGKDAIQIREFLFAEKIFQRKIGRLIDGLRRGWGAGRRSDG